MRRATASTSASRSTCSGAWSTSRWSRPRRTRRATATGCSRRSASTRASASPRRARRRALEARHRDCYLDAGRRRRPGRAAGAGLALDRLEADHDNLRAALAWALRHDPQRALRLAVAHVAVVDGRAATSRRAAAGSTAALAAAPAPTALRADALRAAVGLEIRLGRTSASASSAPSASRSSGRSATAARSRTPRRGGRLRVHGQRQRPRRAALGESRALADGSATARSQQRSCTPRACSPSAAGLRGAPARRCLTAWTGCGAAPARIATGSSACTRTACSSPRGARLAPRMYFEETVQFFRRVTPAARSATSSPPSATCRRPGARRARARAPGTDPGPLPRPARSGGGPRSRRCRLDDAVDRARWRAGRAGRRRLPAAPPAPRLDPGADPVRRQLPRPQGPAPGPVAEHRLRGGPLPEHRRVLGPADGHDHDPRRHMHPGLRLLRGQDRPPDMVRRRRAATGRRGRRGARARARRRHERGP